MGRRDARVTSDCEIDGRRDGAKLDVRLVRRALDVAVDANAGATLVLCRPTWTPATSRSARRR